MLRRISFYLVGVGLGIACSMMFFGDRDIDFSYFPNARVLKHLRAQELVISEKAICQLSCLNMTATSFEKIFKDGDLDINFGDSDTRIDTCKTFLVELDDEKFDSFTVQDCDSTSTLMSIAIEDCYCEL